MNQNMQNGTMSELHIYDEKLYHNHNYTLIIFLSQLKTFMKSFK